MTAAETRSSRKRREEGKLCLCKDMHFCPLQAQTSPDEDHPNYDGMTYQYYPTDEGWWGVREAAVQLGKLAPVWALPPQGHK